MQESTQAQRDKYAVLQRKLEQLERIHADGKRQHQANLDNVTKELLAVRKSNAEQLTRIDKLKKQVDAQDTKIQDSNKSALADQTEIKDLRVKLRVAEAERVRIQAKYNEAVRTKQVLDSTNAARHDELKERDRRIADLERAMALEKRRREDVESQQRDAMSARTEEERAKARTRLEQAEAEAAKVRAELDADRIRGEMQREELVAQVEVLREMLLQAATHYGKLVSETVSKAAHDELRREHSSLQFHTFRLERKLANTEAQVAELASLIRQAHDANGLLEDELRAAEEDKNWYKATLEDVRTDIRCDRIDRSHASLADTVAKAQKEHMFSELEIQEALSSVERRSAASYCGLNSQLVISCTTMRADLDAELLVSQTLAVELQTTKATHDATTADLHEARTELESTRKQLEEASSSLSAARTREAALVQEVKEVKSQNKEQTTAHKHALQKEKETTNRLATGLQQSKVAEGELRAEIDQLTVDLADAERYREAYHKLLDEVGVLAAKNQLAESEADRLSQFNAEILGHNNPAQRIVYLDRVRRELAETKQMLIVATRERDAAGEQIESLRRELSLYLSVPAEGKPRTRTTMTRVGRMPLATQSQNVQLVAGPTAPDIGEDFEKHLPPLVDGANDEMTLDEIM
ncbi:hypothetical protein F5148DRAFT_481584 [Russula earlei]|uniref:Uncharacterized protein n=1 Tax=Russula earlei TaxID=71964 RepID=A0ACC0UH96_9AGAM|nr:hypothetical protein F5148DRAFT_481584 [Russula earlei]